MPAREAPCPRRHIPPHLHVALSSTFNLCRARPPPAHPSRPPAALTARDGTWSRRGRVGKRGRGARDDDVRHARGGEHLRRHHLQHVRHRGVDAGEPPPPPAAPPRELLPACARRTCCSRNHNHAECGRGWAGLGGLRRRRRGGGCRRRRVRCSSRWRRCWSTCGPTPSRASWSSACRATFTSAPGAAACASVTCCGLRRASGLRSDRAQTPSFGAPASSGPGAARLRVGPRPAALCAQLGRSSAAR